ncbi:SUF system NifU family Fe-S cluster assembly protein [Atopobacter sp. AH10]|nr:SUF system NifU family Fe-S cluster assembly protein [Atopobacter sp. AH10]
MALSKLEQLYRQVIVDHYQHPHHHGLPNASANVQTVIVNPSCGDELTMEWALDGETITAVYFDGIGCSISQASASMVTDLFRGKTITEAKALAESFSDMVQGKIEKDEALGEAQVLAGVRNFPARIKCATLAFKAIEQLEKGKYRPAEDSIKLAEESKKTAEESIKPTEESKKTAEESIKGKIAKNK